MKLFPKREKSLQLERLNQIKEKIMNNRWGQISKYFKKWNTEIKKAHGIEHKCLSKTERKRIKKGSRFLRKFEIEFVFEEVE